MDFAQLIHLGRIVLYFREHGYFAGVLADIPGGGVAKLVEILELRNLRVNRNHPTGGWQFQTSASRETLPQEARESRLLVCLYGLGTNAGLKRVASATSGVSYDEFSHFRRRYDGI